MRGLFAEFCRFFLVAAGVVGLAITVYLMATSREIVSSVVVGLIVGLAYGGGAGAVVWVLWRMLRLALRG